ncbi:MAG: (Fe-S)-binding protein [Acidilobaceae archaeon]
MARLRIDFDLRSKLLRASGGTINLCYQCGSCTASCLISPGLPVRTIMRKAQIGVLDDGSSWKCLSCRYCEVTCPRGVRISDVIRGYRIMLYENKSVPERLVECLWKIYDYGNPLGAPRRERLVWAKGLEVFSSGEAAIYSCCMNAYDKRLQYAAKSLVEVLLKAGIKVSVLEGENCCGDIVYNTGEEYYLEELAQSNVSVLEKLKPTVILTLSPHCYNMLKNIYPRYGAKPPAPVLHYTQYIAELITSGRIKPGNLNAKVTYHDPCYLGRWSNIYEEPRTIIQHINGVKFVEMEHNRENSLCCGGGGGAFWMENIESRKVTRERLTEAKNTEAELMSTACPYCIRMFEDELKIVRYSIRVVDVVEILRESLR